LKMRKCTSWTEQGSGGLKISGNLSIQELKPEPEEEDKTPAILHELTGETLGVSFQRIHNPFNSNIFQ